MPGHGCWALFDRLGVGRPRDDGRGFWFDAQQTTALHALIAPYVHPSMGYKLHPTLRDRFAWQPDLRDAHLNGTRLASRAFLRSVPARVLKIYAKPRTRSMARFDLEVEGTHTYLVDGVVVHNSPEVTSGGRALKFYASVRLDIRRIESIKSGDQVLGQRVRVKVVKNKLAAPFRDAELEIIFPRGISKASSLIDVATLQGIVTRTGTWFSYKDMRLGQGRDNAREFLESNPELAVEIEARTREKLGLTRTAATIAAAAAEAAENGDDSRAAPKGGSPSLEPVGERRILAQRRAGAAIGPSRGIGSSPSGDGRPAMLSVAAIRAAGRSGPGGEWRVVVLSDGRSLRVDAEEIARAGLAPGEPLSDDLLERLAARDHYWRAREMAVRLLAARPHSTEELRARFRRGGVPDRHAQAVLDDLTEAGYLDDLAFARGWIASRLRRRPCGSARLRGELRERGVALRGDRAGNPGRLRRRRNLRGRRTVRRRRRGTPPPRVCVAAAGRPRADAWRSTWSAGDLRGPRLCGRWARSGAPPSAPMNSRQGSPHARRPARSRASPGTPRVSRPTTRLRAGDADAPPDGRDARGPGGSLGGHRRRGSPGPARARRVGARRGRVGRAHDGTA